MDLILDDLFRAVPLLAVVEVDRFLVVIPLLLNVVLVDGHEVALE